MGLFLALSGVVGAGPEEVKSSLSGFAQSHGGEFEFAEGIADDPNIGVITRDGSNTTVVYPDGFCEWNEASKYLSRTLKKTVFSLHIHDDDLWMFVLFHNGNEMSWFNPITDYWKELTREEKESRLHLPKNRLRFIGREIKKATNPLLIQRSTSLA